MFESEPQNDERRNHPRTLCFFDAWVCFLGVFLPRPSALLCLLVQSRCFYPVRPLLPFWAEHACLALFQSWGLAIL